MLSMQPQFQPPAGGVRPRLTGSTARLCFALLAHKRERTAGLTQWFGRRRLKMKTAAGFAVSARC